MNRLRELRKQKHLSQQAIADKLHISRQAYSFYENERRALNPTILIKIADFYDVTIDALLGRIYPTNITSPNFDVTSQEIELIKKYRALDERGKEAVDDTLEREYVNSLKTASSVQRDAVSA